MAEDITLKLFILDEECGEDLKFGMQFISERLNYNLEINLSDEEKLLNFPKDYDGYLVHFSQTSEEALISLRIKQPWCKIFVMSGASFSENIFTKNTVPFIDRMYYTVLDYEAEEILKEMHSIYEKK